jgi:predicted methyltransferase
VSKTYIEIECDCETLDELRAFLGAAIDTLYEVTVAGNTMTKKSPVALRAYLHVADTDA